VLAVMIPAVESESLVQRSDLSLRRYAEVLDGLLLQGGHDIAPETYGETPLSPEWHGDRVRDRYELDLIYRFLQAGKPVLGICRGCQLINVALGGTLVQDLPTQRPGALTHLDPRHYERNMHELLIEPATPLAGLYPEAGVVHVNSIHHPAVKDLGRDLQVQARAPDGTIEAIRWQGPTYLFGMQWHPEFMALDGAPDGQLPGAPILREFLAAAHTARRVGAGAA
jgi:putative glutamine amidotransferase